MPNWTEKKAFNNVLSSALLYMNVRRTLDKNMLRRLQSFEDFWTAKKIKLQSIGNKEIQILNWLAQKVKIIFCLSYTKSAILSSTDGIEWKTGGIEMLFAINTSGYVILEIWEWSTNIPHSIGTRQFLKDNWQHWP